MCGGSGQRFQEGPPLPGKQLPVQMASPGRNAPRTGHPGLQQVQFPPTSPDGAPTEPTACHGRRGGGRVMDMCGAEPSGAAGAEGRLCEGSLRSGSPELRHQPAGPPPAVDAGRAASCSLGSAFASGTLPVSHGATTRSQDIQGHRGLFHKWQTGLFQTRQTGSGVKPRSETRAGPRFTGSGSFLAGL